MGILPDSSGVFLKCCFWLGFGYLIVSILYFVVSVL